MLDLNWKKKEILIKPNLSIDWLYSHAGSCCVLEYNDDFFILLITGRDSDNRSVIGKVKFDSKTYKILEVFNKEVLSFGQRGAFDENGVSYPYVVKANEDHDYYMYYTGWMPTVLTPFQNHLGLAVSVDGEYFERYSRAPILERNNEDFLSIGSVCVLEEEDKWNLWYTSFSGWGGVSKHQYHIKYASSEDGIHWLREDIKCIETVNPNVDSCICRPTVLKSKDGYHMIYSYRQESSDYSLGYAFSENGIDWNREDQNLPFIKGPKGSWDSLGQSYPYLHETKEQYLLFYSGNSYGKEGLGLFVADKK